MNQMVGWSSKAEVLMDERDHLIIHISLEADAAEPNAERLFRLQERLIQIENRIAGLHAVNAVVLNGS